MDDKPWLEEDEYKKKNADTVTKILEMFDRNVTLGDKRRIAKYREVLQSRIKEKGYSIEIRNWKRRFTYSSKESEKKLEEIKKENATLKEKQLEAQQTIKSLEEQANKFSAEVKDLQSNIKYGEKEKATQESMYKQQIKKLENDLAAEQKELIKIRQEIRDKEIEKGENKGKLVAAENAQRTAEKLLHEKEEHITRLEKKNSELEVKLREKEQRIKEQEKTVSELKRALEEQKALNSSRVVPTNGSTSLVSSRPSYARTTSNLSSDSSRPKMQDRENPFENNTAITIKNDSELELIPQNVKSISVASSCCNNAIQFELISLRNLESLFIGDECFSHVQKFILDNLYQLSLIKIGTNSFTKKLNGWEENRSRSFKISNCPSLNSITIGQYSFSDYGGDFELANLPRLESLTIGVFDKESWNFSCSSFILRDLPMLKSVILGDKTFGYSTHTVFESIAELLCFIIDLERLETIKVGDNSLNGVPKDDCSLIMKGIFNH